MAFQHFRDAGDQVGEFKGIRDKSVAAEESDRADLSIGRKARQANDRHFVQESIRVNLPDNFVELQMIGRSVEQNQVGLKMECGVQARAGCTFLRIRYFPVAWRADPTSAGQMRLVIDPVGFAGGKSSDGCQVCYGNYSSRYATAFHP